MYEDYFGLERPPFKITPDTSLFFEGGKRGDILAALVYAVHRGEGIIKVVGEVGSGKTMLCRMLQLKLPDTVEIVYIANPSVSAEDILFVIAHELELPIARDSSKHEVMRMLQEYLLQRHMENKQVVLFVEEAQGMPLDTLEEIRLLSNLETAEHKLLQIILFGQPELDQNLSQQSIRQLRERITHNFELEPLTQEEIHSYLNFRMRQVGYTGPELISNNVAKKIEVHSEGLLRRINIIADKILLSAFAEGTHNLNSKHVSAAVNDSAFDIEKPRRSSPLWWIFLLVGVSLAFALYQTRSQWMAMAGIQSPAEMPLSMQADTPQANQSNDGEMMQLEAESNETPTELDASSDQVQSAINVAVAVVESVSEADIASAPVEEAEQAPVAVEAAASEPVKEAEQEPVAVETAASEPVEEAEQAPVAVETAASEPVKEAEQEPAVVDEVSPEPIEGAVQTVAPVEADEASQEEADAAPIQIAANDQSEVSVPVLYEETEVLSSEAQTISGSQTAATENTDVATNSAHEEIVVTLTEVPAQPIDSAVAKLDPENRQWLGSKLQQSRRWLDSSKRQKLSIQVMMRKKSAARELVYYLRNEWPLDITQTYLYEVEIEGRSVYRVFYREFDSMNQAQSEIELLPDSVKVNSPYVHSVSRMRRALL